MPIKGWAAGEGYKNEKTLKQTSFPLSLAPLRSGEGLTETSARSLGRNPSPPLRVLPFMPHGMAIAIRGMADRLRHDPYARCWLAAALTGVYPTISDPSACSPAASIYVYPVGIRCILGVSCERSQGIYRVTISWRDNEESLPFGMEQAAKRVYQNRTGGL